MRNRRRLVCLVVMLFVPATVASQGRPSQEIRRSAETLAPGEAEVTILAQEPAIDQPDEDDESQTGLVAAPSPAPFQPQTLVSVGALDLAVSELRADMANMRADVSQYQRGVSADLATLTRWIAVLVFGAAAATVTFVTFTTKSQIEPFRSEFRFGMEKVEDFSKRIESARRDLHDRVDFVGNRFEGIEKKFGGLEQRVVGLESGFRGLEHRVRGLENGVERLTEGMGEFYRQLHNMRADLPAIIEHAIKHAQDREPDAASPTQGSSDEPPKRRVD